ncbi:MAG: Swarming motility protein SwrC [Bacillales bacterium]|jgi:HAE1 family hydrophobic/amphiphilic exporter-1|nr:Swarming motility protein SwrC [Bacillales bacterium]
MKNKLAVWLLTIIITVAGLYSGMNMKMETLPEINPPLVTVTTIYPGAAPEEVLDKITEPMELKVRNLEGVNIVSSTSLANASSIQIEYNYKKDMEEAEQEVKEALSNFVLPDGAKEPSISRLSLNAFPVMTMSISNERLTLSELTKLVEEEISPNFEGVDGVSSIKIAGQQVEEVQLTYNKEKLAKFGLTTETIEGIIKGSVIKFPLGLYTFDNTQKTVVIDGNIVTLEDLKNIEIPAIPQQQSPTPPMQSKTPQQAIAPTANQLSNGVPTVKLSDIADLKIVGEAESISRTNGKESISIQVIKSADANTVDVVNRIKDEVEKLKEDITGLEIESVYDQGKPIEDSVHTMLNKALIGAGFAILIILLFLRDFRSTIISVISIPLSLLIAILLLDQMDITLNIMTLGAMTVAIGRVVDDSIVVIENIYRRMSLENEQLKGFDLIREATKEMFIPILSSTIVTIAVFLPLGFVTGPVGEMFMPFALTMVFALLASLLVAVTIVPMMAHSFFKKGVKQSHSEEKPGRLANTYKKILRWTLNHKFLSFGFAMALLIGSFFLVPIIGVSFLPEEEEKMVVATYSPAPGQTSENVEKLALDAEEYFLSKNDVEIVQYSVGGENPMNPAASNQALFFIKYKDDTENFSEVKEKVFKDLEEKLSENGEWGSMDMGAGGSNNSITLFVYGNGIGEVKPIVDEITSIIKKEKDLTNVKTSISESYDQYTFIADQAKLSKYGLTAGQLAMALAQNHSKPILTTINKDGKELNVYVQVDKDSFADIRSMEKKTLKSPLGIEVPIKDVAEVKEGKASDTISRRNGKLYAQVTAEVTIDDVGKVSKELKEKVDKEIKLPKTAEISFGGVTEQINETFTQLGLAMLAAIAVVYLVLVITFGGGLAPFAILFSLPFSIIGGLVGLLVTGETISVSAMMGALMLIGIVVTNAIVLVDRVRQKEEEGLSTREALLEAGATRLRPILMTAIATIGALIPLAIGMEGGGLISKGLGVTVIGGLTSSTILTLIIVPIVYEFFKKFGKKKELI